VATQRIIYIDFDDVLCETARALSAVVGRRFGKHVPFEKIHFFDLQRSFGLTEEETAYLLAAFHDVELLASLQPVPGAVEGVRSWHTADRGVWIVTGRPPGTYEASRSWLTRHGVPFDRLIMVDKYSRNHPPEVGVPIMSMEEVYAEEFALVVEDSLDVAGCLLRNTEVPVALLDRPWNTDKMDLDEETLGRLSRCRDWSDLVRLYPSP